MSRPLTRRERHTAEVRASIVTAAKEVLIERGATALTLDAVSERADVAIQTIYNRVGNRADLLRAVAETAFEQNHVYLDEVLSASTDGLSAFDRLRRAFAAYTRFASERPFEFRMLAHPPVDDVEVVRRTQELADGQSRKLADILRQGIKEGEFNPELDPDVTATALWAMGNGVLELQWRNGAYQLNNTSTLTTAVLEAFVTIIQSGITNSD